MNHFYKRTPILFLIALTLSTLLAPTARALQSNPTNPTPPKPNVIVILVDDLGIGDLSAYGAKDLKSPNIDKLIASGMKFNNFYANCPVCSPSRAALLSGRYPELIGVPGVIRTYPQDNWGYMTKEATLLPKILKPAGYHTAIVGKWHLGLEKPNRPTDRGFDHFKGYLGDMMDDYYNHRRHGINYMRLNEQEIKPTGHATDLFTQWASDYITQQAKTKNPFFLYLAYNAPHTPIQPPKEWVAKVKAREQGITDKRAKLVALIEHMDHGIGQVLDTLKQTGQHENTLVIFASDNGGQTNVGGTNGPWRGSKQEVYEGGIRVPACAVWPGHIKPGSQNNENLLLMDIYPTVAQVAGAKINHTIEGISFLDILKGNKQTLPARHLFFCRREGNNRYMGLTIQAVRVGDYKLLQNSPFQPFELYNLKEDPREQNNLANKNRKVYNDLAKIMRKQLQIYGTVPWQKPGLGN